MALRQLRARQEKAIDILKPHIRQITLDLLTLIRDTENGDLTSILQSFVRVYAEDLAPLAVEITTHLAQTFAKVLESNASEQFEDKSIIAKGILRTLGTICSVMEGQAEIIVHIEGVVVFKIKDVISVLLHNISEFLKMSTTP